MDGLKGRFNILGVAGSGGQGYVFHASRIQLPSGEPCADEVALKLYGTDARDERVEREIRLVRTLRHPSMAALLEEGSVRLPSLDRSIRFMAWEFIRGRPLNEVLAEGPLSARMVAVIGRDIATAIGEIWRQKIVHRDVNPKNVILRDGSESAVLIDLGLARHLGESTLTAVGFACGTPGYMSPEQASAEHQLTSGCDVFGLGLTMFCSLLGAHPYKSDQHLLMKMLATPILAANLLPEAAPRLTHLIDKMLTARIAFRPSTRTVAQACAEMASQL